ncbi:hypothetical protein N7532_002555 [Penicillium argentinense]|uniref:Uncharacterized protein n=1 Tax=Penicillium argentinense TaxID=1131581 RepID=A0A9W9G1J3_9EURO|nr:uncharacterized protein N7532_002555 [Penicillium argentinense]KAJ5109910.1 hypothetical protein N7532_002555 [Penicillium argentinense]
MRFSVPAILVRVFIRTSFGGALQVIDEDRECKIYSNDNHGCTGYSASFGKLNGDDCSEISEVVNGTRKDSASIDVAACGTENGKNVAWILVNQTGEVTFFNQNGDKAGSCNASDHEPLTTTSAILPLSLPATSTPAQGSSSSTASSSSDTGSSPSTCACA